MAESTSIAWCDATFNPWIGCTKVSPGCDHCYAEADFDLRKHRVKWGAGQPRSRTSTANWKKPIKWNREQFLACGSCGWRGTIDGIIGKKIGDESFGTCRSCGGIVEPARRRVFCASLGDVFDNEVPRQWRQDLFDLILATPQLDWLLVTKRIGIAARMLEEIAVVRGALLDANDHYRPPKNVWIGATVVNQAEADRDIPKLLRVPAHVRFLSIEPMLGPIDVLKWLDDGSNDKALASTLDWIICGGESGPCARPMHPDWARSLRDQCNAAGVAFNFKQHGEWLATDFCSDEQAMIPPKCVVYVRPDGTFHDGSNGIDFFNRNEQETGLIGKRAAGRLLDGVLHNKFPEVER